MATIPTLDMTNWSITDFEVVYAALTVSADGITGVLCQRRSVDGGNNYRPGAKAIEQMLENIDGQFDAMREELARRRFDDPAQDDARVRLILRHDLNHRFLDAAELVQVALDQALRSAA